MNQAIAVSRRPFAPNRHILRFQLPCIRVNSTLATSAEACASAEDQAGVPVGLSAFGRDRTSEASTSVARDPDLAANAKRVRPTPLTPGRIEDLNILQNGVILVDKPLGWTSFGVCGKIRNKIRFLGVKKVGHAGTLDPNASGLLIVCTGKGTKFCDDFMAQDKEYSGTIRLGEGTASYDAESEVSERAPWEHITDADVAAAASRFVGDIQQVPPMYSAIKRGGVKMYQLAREGLSVDLPPRAVSISALRVWRSETNRQELHFQVACSKGTYIRSLAYDMGRALGTAAHLVALRREAVGAYRVGAAWDLQQLIREIEVHRTGFQEQLEASSIVTGAVALADAADGAGVGVGGEFAGPVGGAQ